MGGFYWVLFRVFLGGPSLKKPGVFFWVGPTHANPAAKIHTVALTLAIFCHDQVNLKMVFLSAATNIWNKLAIHLSSAWTLVSFQKTLQALLLNFGYFTEPLVKNEKQYNRFRKYELSEWVILYIYSLFSITDKCQTGCCFIGYTLLVISQLKFI